MDSNDWSHLIVASNEAAMQWYSLVTQKAPPVTDQLYTPLPYGGSLSMGTNTGTLVIIGVALVVALLVFKD